MRWLQKTALLVEKIKKKRFPLKKSGAAR